MGLLSAVENAKTTPEKRPPVAVQEQRFEADPIREPPPVDAAFLEGLTLEELGRTDYVLTLWSEVLGDTVLLVPDHYRKAEGDPVTYTPREMAALLYSEPDRLRAVHAVKKVLGGRLLWTKTGEEMEKEETP